MVLIRKMNQEDIQEVYKLGSNEKRFKVGAETSGFWSKQQLIDWVKEDKDILLVAEEDNLVVGFLLTRFHFATKKVDWENLKVNEDYTGRGIGKKLTEEMFKQLKKIGAKYIVAIVEEDNSAIMSLLGKNNFKEGKKIIWMDKFI